MTVLGAVIAGITLVSNTVFTEDYRTYGDMITALKADTKEIELNAGDFPFRDYKDFKLVKTQMDENRKTAIELYEKIVSEPLYSFFYSEEEEARNFSGNANEIENNIKDISFGEYDHAYLSKAVIGERSGATEELSGEVNRYSLWGMFGPGEAQAQGVQPAWINNHPSHPRYHMFVAQGEGRRLREAHQNAMADVHRQIDKLLDRNYRGKYLNPESLIDLSRNLRSEIKRKSSFRQTTQGGYKYYLLVQLKKRTVKRFAKYYLE